MVDISDLAGIGLGDYASLGLGIVTLIILVTLWKLIWYGLALYKTIERKQIVWFVVLFVAAFLLGDLGILAIIYLLVYKKHSTKLNPAAKQKKK